MEEKYVKLSDILGFYDYNVDALGREITISKGGIREFVLYIKNRAATKEQILNEEKQKGDKSKGEKKTG